MLIQCKHLRRWCVPMVRREQELETINVQITRTIFEIYLLFSPTKRHNEIHARNERVEYHTHASDLRLNYIE